MNVMKKKSVFIILVLVGLIAYHFSKKETAGPSRSASKDVAVATGENALPAVHRSVASETPPLVQSTLSVQSEKPTQQKQMPPEEIEHIRQKVKSLLSGAYASQMAFKAEYDQYVSDIMVAGVSLDPVVTFKAGFLERSAEPPGMTSQVNIDVRRMNTDSLMGERDEATNEVYEYAPNVQDIDLSAYKGFCKYGCTANKDHFEMMMAVPLGSAEKVDVWIINDQKEIIQVKDGTKSLTL